MNVHITADVTSEAAKSSLEANIHRYIIHHLLAVFGLEAEYTRDKSPAHCRATIETTIPS